jgi:hypothetical protein
MARQIHDKEALHLYELLGAPLLAVVQAEAQAAQASAEFIRRIGFEDNSTGERTAEPESPALLQEGGRLGNLKMASFLHPVSGSDGKIRDHETQIPVLSLFPLPLLQVKYGEFEFAVKIIEHSADMDTDSEPAEPANDSPRALPGSDSPSDFLSSHRLGMKASVARQPTGTEERRMDMHMKVKIRMEQADLPSGITKLLNLMDRSINSSLHSSGSESAERNGQ